MGAMSLVADHHDELRPLMFSIAYRMLGSVAEAEDVVQDAFLRMHRSEQDGAAIESPDAFATTVTTRLAIDALRSARRRREQYVGTWLPEPILAAEDADPARKVELDETVSVAFLAVLERLSPTERAVFLLREVFGHSYAEIASVVEKSEANCRQLLARARRHIDEQRPRFDPSPEHRTELAGRFFAAMATGDTSSLERLLAEDVVFYGDGGGKAPAILQPLSGAVEVARFLDGLRRQGERFSVTLEPVEANGQPAARIVAGGVLYGVLCLEIDGDRVVGLRNQINPDKLGHLGEVGDMFAVMRGS
jgi:RNA polymerase sigma-70 factor (ECF subfamily)